jgi:FkbM family methyltransferase
MDFNLVVDKLNTILSVNAGIFNKVTDLILLEKYNHIKKKSIKGEYINIPYKDINIRFFVPNYHTDYIQKLLVLTQKFYEINLLELFENLLKKYNVNYKGKIFIDAGANIGNHTLFFSKILQASKIYCFEPQKEIFKTLKKNIRANSVKAKCYNNVLSDVSENFSFGKFEPDNFGATNFINNADGKYKSLILDDVCLRDEICVLKIDVEGHELPVLKGATKILEKYSPVLWVEVKSGLEDVINFLSQFGYMLVKRDYENCFFFKTKELLQ